MPNNTSIRYQRCYLKDKIVVTLITKLLYSSSFFSSLKSFKTANCITGHSIHALTLEMKILISLNSRSNFLYFGSHFWYFKLIAKKIGHKASIFSSCIMLLPPLPVHDELVLVHKTERHEVGVTPVK